MLRGIQSRYANYSFHALRKDAISGVIVGIVAIPLAMAFAIASGVRPEFGIYTTIFAGILIALFGGSRFQIGGPTGAFVPILLSIVLVHGYANLLVAGFMAGVILLLLGIFKLGNLIAYIPRPVTVGFTAGIAVTIFSGQIANFLGLTHLKKHDTFLPSMMEIVRHLSGVHAASVVIGLTCFITILCMQKWLPKVPGSLVGLVVSTVVSVLFFKGQAATIGSTYGSIPSRLPSIHVLNLSLVNLEHLIGPAFVIAMLGGIESLLSAVVADGMTNARHDSNRELIGQGIANMAVPWLGGIPATGAIARTATNIKSGAVSPVSGIIHGIFVAVVLLSLAPLASQIPLASMAPILMLVAWNMSERREFVHLIKIRNSDAVVLVATFGLTVFANLTLAVGVGLLLSVVLFAKRMSASLEISKVLPDGSTERQKVTGRVVNEAHDCPQISIFTIDGALFFAAAQAFEKTILKAINYQPKVLILRMSRVTFLDSTCESYLNSLIRDFHNKGGIVLISGLRNQPREMMMRTGLYATVGNMRFFEHTGDAIQEALQRISVKACAHCSHFAFQECKSLSNVRIGI